MDQTHKNIELSISNNLSELLKKYEITVSNTEEEKIIMKALTYYIYNMIINVCALLSIITKINNPENNTVRTKDVKDAIQQIKAICIDKEKNNNEKTGGGSGYGNKYTEEYMIVYYNSPNLIRNLERVNIVEEIELFDKSYVDEIFKGFGVKISSNTLKLVQKLMKVHLKCLLNDLKKQGKLTIKRIEYVVDKSRNVVFT